MVQQDGFWVARGWCLLFQVLPSQSLCCSMLQHGPRLWLAYSTCSNSQSLLFVDVKCFPHFSPPQEWPTHNMVYYTCLLHVWIKLETVGRPGQPGPARDLLASSGVSLSHQRYRENERTCSVDENAWDGYELSLKVLNILKGLRSLQPVTRITQQHPDASRFCENAVPLHDFVGSCVQSHASSLHQGKLMRPSCYTGYTLQRNNWQRLAWYQIHLS